MMLEAVEESRKGGNRTQEGGILVGLAGISRDLRVPGGARGELAEIAPAIAVLTFSAALDSP